MGQVTKMQAAVSLAFPGQLSPPLSGAGLLQSRTRLRVPPDPQDREQGPNAPHVPHPPSVNLKKNILYL